LTNPIEYRTKINFMDYKEAHGRPKFNSPEDVISRGTRFTYQVKEGKDGFFKALAMTEMVKGIGSRTSFGKGEIKLM